MVIQPSTVLAFLFETFLAGENAVPHAGKFLSGFLKEYEMDS